MSDWEDDDYDPTAQLSEARLVELGLDSKKADPKASASIAQERKSSAAFTNGSSAGLGSNQPHELLTEEERRAAQLDSDRKFAMGLFGFDDQSPTNERTAAADFSASSLKSKEDFVRFGEKFGAEVASRSDSPFYLDMIIALVDHVTKPMKKIPLESVETVIRKHLDVFLRKEETEQQKVVEQKQQREQKKIKKKQLVEDLVQDDYDDFADKYY